MLEDDTPFNFKPSNHDSATSNLSIPETIEFPGDISEKPAPLCPKSMWRWTSQSATARGARETYDEFKSRLDGHRRQGDTSSFSKRAPSLQFLARLPTIKLNFDEDDEQTTAPANYASEISNHRCQALNALEGGVASQTVRFTDADLPTSLIPGGIKQATDRESSTGYKPYRSSDVSHLIVPDTVPTFTRKMRNKKQPVDLIGPFDEDFNKRHSQNYCDVESGVFNEAVIGKATGGASMDGNTGSRSSLLPPTPPKTPEMLSATSKAIKRKPVSTPPPTNNNPTSTLDLIKMVDNGYPLLERGIQQRFSSAPAYQARFVNDVEAKFAKAEKVKQLKQLRRETKKTYSMQKREFLTEQERKKVEELDRLDEQLRKLMCI
ncbi:hypothetical protein BDY17DRAFT_304805 [Neohortaea acidophila]|uniref:Uncharacterized protein n=1 Tax=Neohortaea acidophila TaxID=245834 RepID=A0A6A6PGY1_9PEZI|nr:uncharacterized protein BDY17DRAFT_304805 [Neohortaea acidophila]KAF2478991.1 hypothetical protein BDY17DRAFT_304805 [Neohortaea acidophila]